MDEVDLPKPLAVIVPRDEQSMKALAPQYWERKGGVRPGSVWVTGPDQHYIAIRSDMRVEDNVMVNPHASAYFSYANLIFISSFEGTVPMWLSRGLAGVISNTLVRQSDVIIGAPIPWHLERLRERRLPLRQMLAVTRQSPQFRREEGMRYFDAVRANLKRPQVSVLPNMHKAIALEPSNPWHRLAAARVLGRLNAFDEARKAAESAIKLADEQDEAVRTEARRILALLKDR